ncbi:polyprenyl synthetase family protein [Streptomonospora nanhaiensis]|uniref:Geranylgeranyl diphosphate synthase type I n=1 Tax=Streptomonospora nanhaiensis TaxID=1323731 RepID=A0A853BIS6_9ACTN|nr:polyprenyl synthetase family protein [Streptomonospora nanhaiensis]MBV2362431.1 polyprenyl synthetase family protein [Streptomonospora nanhaiensis]MBX9389180.1 polyprenyl synthetase family protein [Streptomonospora nanhaiensis]NYI94910.1 geranylgeranyl diphosphate synthase type I [Streptomonospora nanhaiensis]
MTSSDSSPVAFVRAAVDAELARFVAERRAQLLEIGGELAPVVDALEAMLAGGKRLRPAFCYWGWRGAGGADTPDIHAAAASLEFLQACALVHDDVIDNSDTRRGMPATHKRMEELHARSGWSGAADGFGRGAAILIGDLCLAWSEDMYQASGLGLEALRAGRRPFDAMRTEVMAGQYLDMLEQVREDGGVEAALRVMHYKAAKYTVERPLHLGAALAGRYDDLGPVYSAYGLPLGLAFQLRDDILGVFGDPGQTGKPAGDDLREGKRTLLVAETLDRAAPADAAEFRRHLGDPALTPERVEWMRALVEDCGALAACERRIDDLVGQATAALNTDLIDDTARAPLADLIVAATARKH